MEMKTTNGACGKSQSEDEDGMTEEAFDALELHIASCSLNSTDTHRGAVTVLTTSFGLLLAGTTPAKHRQRDRESINDRRRSALAPRHQKATQPAPSVGGLHTPAPRQPRRPCCYRSPPLEAELRGAGTHELHVHANPRAATVPSCFLCSACFRFTPRSSLPAALFPPPLHPL